MATPGGQDSLLVQATTSQGDIALADDRASTCAPDASRPIGQHPLARGKPGSESLQSTALQSIESAGIAEAQSTTDRFASKAYADGMLDAFDKLGCGAILLSRAGIVLQSNNEAKIHLNQAIRILGGKLAACDGNANESLQKLIARVVAGSGVPREPDANVVVVPRGAGRPLVVYATLVSAGSREELHETAGIILLVDPDNHREPAEAILQRAFDLTPAETRLALGLIRGHDLQAIAQLNGVRVGTLRIQLKSIFTKTQTSRQAELVTLLSKFSLVSGRADANGTGSSKLPRDL